MNGNWLRYPFEGEFPRKTTHPNDGAFSRVSLSRSLLHVTESPAASAARSNVGLRPPWSGAWSNGPQSASLLLPFQRVRTGSNHHNACSFPREQCRTDQAAKDIKSLESQSKPGLLSKSLINESMSGIETCLRKLNYA